MHYNVCFLPWYRIEKSLTIGPVTLWPYEEAGYRIKDEKIKQWLDKYFQIYIDHTGKTVSTITICSINDDFVYRENDFQQIRNAINCLIFAAIMPQTLNGVRADNSSVGPPSSDVFELVHQGFMLDSDYISVRAGSRLSGGLKIGEVLFSRPWATGGSFIKIDEEILEGLNNCFQTCMPRDAKHRIFRSLEWFRLAHTESLGDLLSRVVMMATAFEILLDMKSSMKARSFAEKVEETIATPSFAKEERKVGIEVQEHTVAYGWAFNFYKLRNGIVHGDTIVSDQLKYKEWITHLIVADIVFWELLFYELLRNKWIGNKVHEFARDLEACSEDPGGKEMCLQSIVGMLYGLTYIHRTLGWIP